MNVKIATFYSVKPVLFYGAESIHCNASFLSENVKIKYYSFNISRYLSKFTPSLLFCALLPENVRFNVTLH